MVKLIICDIDGTITNHERVLSERTLKTIGRIHDKGMYFGIASGRQVDEIKVAIKKWNLKVMPDVLIGMNGSELYDLINDKFYSYFKLEKSWIKEILDLMKDFKTNPLMYVDNYLLCKYEDDLVTRSIRHSGKIAKKVEDMSEFYAEENAKIMFRVAAEDMEDIEKHIRQNPSPNYKGFKTQPTMVEFTDVRTNKGYALNQFCLKNKISLEDVVAFGDTTNDNEMLEISGKGVCLKNGSEDTKIIADDITSHTSVEDGFAIYCEEVLNIISKKEKI